MMSCTRLYVEYAYTLMCQESKRNQLLTREDLNIYEDENDENEWKQEKIGHNQCEI